ncbi:MAG: molecular chaperone DnaJ [Acidimicrobiia bacterium]|nr:molecular chaperone DnaJ [Acidimicrobiia bacterium]MDH3399248.1 molecular chaperone DnaJ [Acidimicrobiia bacterium]MDH5615566.1 molecular chaperone DnaJ [Acidimicrobiia bacterium]
MSKDFYDILGVSRDASTEEIKKAFRRLARDSHPDANPDDPTAEARFREIAEAYEVLSDPERRHRYDRGDTIDLSDLFASFGGFDDLIRSVFGDSGLFSTPTRQTNRGRDVLVPTQISLAEAAFGVTRELEFAALVGCETCHGSGAAPGTESETCSKCGGAGAVRVARRGFLGSVMTLTACDLCAGSGQMIRVPCETCRGRGLTSGERLVSVEIPGGVSEGTRLRLTGQGEPGSRGARRGDLFVEIHVADDDRFVRDGDDLIVRIDLGLAQAALGTEVETPLIEGGFQEIEVPRGTQPGTVFSLRGKGMDRLGRRGRGDMLVEINVHVPEDLSKEEEEALRAYASVRGEETSRTKRRRRSR